MTMLLGPTGITGRQRAMALTVAALADVLQIVILPAFFYGGALAQDVIDVVAVIVLLLTLGFKWRLAGVFLIELIPGLQLFPTWTLVVLSLQVVDAVTGPRRSGIKVETLNAPPVRVPPKQEREVIEGEIIDRE